MESNYGSVDPKYPQPLNGATHGLDRKNGPKEGQEQTYKIIHAWSAG